MRSNPLLPIPPRIKAAHHSDVRVGVHTTGDIERSTWYAVSAAATNDPSEEPNVGIILELDVSGLVPVPDYDALYLQETIGGIAEQDLLSEEEALLAIEMGDGEVLTDIAQNIIEFGESFWDERIENWNDALRYHLGGEKTWDVLGAFAALRPEEAVEAALVAQETGLFPAEVYMNGVDQRRYLQPIGFDRLLAVYAVHPVDVDRIVTDWTEEEYVEEGEAPLVMDLDDPIPPMRLLWERKKHGAEPEYHGTDLFAARAAFPEIADEINNPWDFGQPYNPIRWSGWAKPMRAGVGVYPVAEDTGRMLVGLRSKKVQTPGHWSGFGGLLEPGESFEQAARRELREETGYSGTLELEEFAPSMYFGYVPREYRPKLNWETERAFWIRPEELQELSPRHWGVDVLVRSVLQKK
jgi:8-oxo-dGTP pyrophosphatase MutT (NUDIX family)